MTEAEKDELLKFMEDLPEEWYGRIKKDVANFRGYSFHPLVIAVSVFRLGVQYAKEQQARGGH